MRYFSYVLSLSNTGKKTHDRNEEVEFYVKVDLGGKSFQNSFRAVVLKFRIARHQNNRNRKMAFLISDLTWMLCSPYILLS